MTEEQIKKEHNKLILAQMEAMTEVNFFYKYRIQILEELNTMGADLVKGQSTESLQSLSEEELSKLNVSVKKYTFHVKAGQELVTLIERMTAKSDRKLNEINKKLKLFCKRHGIENTSASILNS